MSKFIPRLYTINPLGLGGKILLSQEQSHYLSKVLRKKEGDLVHLFNGIDGEWEAKLCAQSKKSVIVELQNCFRNQEPEKDVWLLCPPLKGSRTEDLIEKATELGISKYIPILTEQTSVRRINHERIQSKAIEAAEQCERLTIPEITALTNLTEVLQSWKSDRKLYYGAERVNVETMSFVEGKIAFLVGPEGGFSISEMEKLSDLSFTKGVNLGSRILRADTAALVMLARSN